VCRIRGEREGEGGGVTTQHRKQTVEEREGEGGREREANSNKHVQSLSQSSLTFPYVKQNRTRNFFCSNKNKGTPISFPPNESAPDSSHAVVKTSFPSKSQQQQQQRRRPHKPV